MVTVNVSHETRVRLANMKTHKLTSVNNVIVDLIEQPNEDDVREMNKIIRMQEDEIEELQSALRNLQVEIGKKKMSYDVLETKYLDLKYKQ